MLSSPGPDTDRTPSEATLRRRHIGARSTRAPSLAAASATGSAASGAAGCQTSWRQMTSASSWQIAAAAS